MVIHVKVEEREGVHFLRLEGRLDAASSPALEERLDPLYSKENLRVVMDFAQVSYVSSAGMRLLLSASKRMSAAGGRFILISLQQEVEEVLEIAGVDRLLTLCKTEEEAKAAL